MTEIKLRDVVSESLDTIRSAAADEILNWASDSLEINTESAEKLYDTLYTLIMDNITDLEIVPDILLRAC